MAVKQTAGREKLGTFAPKFAELNDDVLFGEVWSREDTLSLRDRSLVTVVSLMAQGLVDSSFQYPPDDREEKRHHESRDRGNSDSRRVLCRLAEGLGGIQHGKGGLGGGRNARQREGRARIGAFQTLFSNFRRNSHV